MELREYRGSGNLGFQGDEGGETEKTVIRGRFGTDKGNRKVLIYFFFHVFGLRFLDKKLKILKF